MLWDSLKTLKIHAPIYQGTMDEDENSTPENYVILEEQTFDESFAQGDGDSLIRKSTFNIRIYCRKLSKAKTVVAAYRTSLNTQKIAYKQFGPTFDQTTNIYSTLITGATLYGT